MKYEQYNPLLKILKYYISNSQMFLYSEFENNSMNLNYKRYLIFKLILLEINHYILIKFVFKIV